MRALHFICCDCERGGPDHATATQHLEKVSKRRVAVVWGEPPVYRAWKWSPRRADRCEISKGVTPSDNFTAPSVPTFLVAPRHHTSEEEGGPPERLCQCACWEVRVCALVWALRELLTLFVASHRGKVC